MLELSNLIQILSLANLGDLQENLMKFILAIPYFVCVCVCVCVVYEIVWYVSVSRSVEIYLKTNLLSCVFNK